MKKIFPLVVLVVLAVYLGTQLLSDADERPPFVEGIVDDYEIKYSSFPQEVNLAGEDFLIKEGFLRYPFRIRQDEDCLYILDLHGPEFYCHIYGKNDLSRIASFAPKGNGPQEVLQAMDIHVVSKDSIFLFDTNKREITLWRFSPADSTVSLKESYSMRDEMIYSSNCTWETDSSFFFTDKSGANRIVKCNKSGEVVESIGSIPTIQNAEEKEVVLAQAWNSYISYHPSRQILVVATQLGDVLEVYHLRDKSRYVLYGPYKEPIYDTFQNRYAIPTGIMGYSDVQVTDRYIYAVFHGRSFEDIIKDPRGTPDGGQFIHIYSHTGVPVCRLILDHFIYGIDVDEENGVIWATDVNSDEQIVRYSIPDVLLGNNTMFNT